MKFFTAQLFADLNSNDDEVVEQAEEQWEAARKEYHAHFRRVEKRLPTSLVRLCRMVSLHDSRVQGSASRAWVVYENGERGQGSRAIVSVRLEHADFDLFYLDPPEPTRLTRPVDSPVFHEENVIWLYDEVDCLKGGIFSHEILFSNGNVLRVTFQDFKYIERPIIDVPLFQEFTVPVARKPHG
jgi:hypothetical protein